MTDSEPVAVEQIVRSLSFDVVAIPGQSQKVVPSNTSKAAPLSVKIRVKKKHEGGLQHGVLAIPVKNPDEVPQRIRLVSSDQTIMSFNAVMEDIDFDKSRARKANLTNIHNAPLSASTTEASHSESAFKNKFLLSKVQGSNKKRDIFGRCKPGGCLDPPFGEDKYSYEPSKQNQKPSIQDTPERKKTSSIFSNKLFKKRKKSKTEKADGKEGEEDDQSVVGLYDTGSLETSASNSIITYPSPSNGSDDKVVQDKQKSPRNSAARKSNESDNGSLYIVPKKTRASLEKEEAKLKTDRDDFDLSKEVGNNGDVRKLDDVEKIDPLVLNNPGEGVPEYVNTERQQFDVADTIDEKTYQGKNIITSGPEIVEYLSGDLDESENESEIQDKNATSGVKTGLIAASVAAATAGVAATFLTDLKDDDKTSSDNSSVEKLSGDNNEINKTIFNDPGNNKVNETTSGNVTDDKTKHRGIDDGDQLSTNTIDDNYSEVNKYEGIVIEDGSSEEGFLNKDSSKIVQNEAEGIEGDTNEFLDKGLDNDYLVSEDRGNINNMPSDDLSSNREFVNEISSLDTSDKINKQVSKNDLVEEITQAKIVVFTDPLTKDEIESKSEYQTPSTWDTNTEENGEDGISVKDKIISDKMSQKDEDILSVLEGQTILQDMLEKGKEFLELDETGKEFVEPGGTGKEFQKPGGIGKDFPEQPGKGKEFPELESKGNEKEERELDGSRENIIDNDGKSRGNVSNDVNKKDIYSDRHGGSSSGSEKITKTGNLDTDVIKDGESISGKTKDNLKDLKVNKNKKAADGDKQKKRKAPEEQFKTKIDLGFHTYTNEKDELILKTFDSKTTPIRYPRDSVIMTNCDLKDPFELKVPFGTEKYFWIQIKDNENMINMLPSSAKSSRISLIGKAQKPKLNKINEEEMNGTVKNATKTVKSINKDIIKAQIKDIYGTYENELVPLQKSLTRLKQDVEVLILHQKAIRNNLLSRRIKFQANRKCGCVRKL